MTLDKASLQAVIERLEKADGPDRELDARIHAVANPDDLDMKIVGYLPGEVCVNIAGLKGMRSLHAYKYTASVDAAIALTERMLPGGGWCVDKSMASVWPRDVYYEIEAEAATPAISLLLALFKALLAKEQSDD